VISFVVHAYIITSLQGRIRKQRLGQGWLRSGNWGLRRRHRRIQDADGWTCQTYPAKTPKALTGCEIGTGFRLWHYRRISGYEQIQQTKEFKQQCSK